VYRGGQVKIGDADRTDRDVVTELIDNSTLIEPFIDSHVLDDLLLLRGILWLR
jgi:hypothetical protein